MKPTNPSHNNAIFIGIDFHKRYSVFCVIDSTDRVLDKGRIDHSTPELFIHLIKRYPGCRVVFETTMNCPSLRSRLANMASLDFKAAK